MKDVELFIEEIKKKIDAWGGPMYDKHLKRDIVSSVGRQFTVLPALVKRLMNRKYLDKYKADWERMHPSFVEAADQANLDPWSRQLLVFNVQNYHEVKQCFNTIQFCRSALDEDYMIVNQRSSDLAKLEDDMIFFANVAEKWNNRTGFDIQKIILNFGNVHYEIKK